MKGEAWFYTCNLNIAGVVFCLPNFNRVLIFSALFIFVFLLFYRRCSKFPNRLHFSLTWTLREPSLATSKMLSLLLFLPLTIHTFSRKQVIQRITCETRFLKLYPSVRESQVGRIEIVKGAIEEKENESGHLGDAWLHMFTVWRKPQLTHGTYSSVDYRRKRSQGAHT